MASIVEKQMTVIVPNMADFMSKNLSSSEKILLTNLKLEIDNIIKFFKEQFVLSDDSDIIIDSKLDSLSTIGYDNLFKISAYLNILYLKDERICNKQLYEQCLNSTIPNGAFLETIERLRDYNNDLDINAIFDKAKVIKNLENNKDSESSLAMLDHKIHIKMRNNKLSKINVYNSNINNYILTSYAMKQILFKAN
jgi:hypothetical protein